MEEEIIKSYAERNDEDFERVLAGVQGLLGMEPSILAALLVQESINKPESPLQEMKSPINSPPLNSNELAFSQKTPSPVQEEYKKLLEVVITPPNSKRYNDRCQDQTPRSRLSRFGESKRNKIRQMEAIREEASFDMVLTPLLGDVKTFVEKFISKRGYFPAFAMPEHWTNHARNLKWFVLVKVKKEKAIYYTTKAKRGTNEIEKSFYLYTSAQPLCTSGLKITIHLMKRTNEISELGSNQQARTKISKEGRTITIEEEEEYHVELAR